MRELAAAGVDVIKIMATGGVLDPGARRLDQHFTDEEMKGIVDMAHSIGLKVAAHAHGAKGIDAAVRAGVDSIEHGTFVDEQGIKDMKARGTYYVATLMAFSGDERALGKGLLTPESEAKGPPDARRVGTRPQHGLSRRREDRARHRQRGRSAY